MTTKVAEGMGMIKSNCLYLSMYRGKKDQLFLIVSKPER